jgi:Terpene cyclase DEP1
MNRKFLYLVLVILGFVLPYSLFVPWVMEHGLDMRLFVRQLFANRVSAFFGLDVLVSAAALIAFIRNEGRRLKMNSLWLPVASVLLVGVSLGLPLFLYLRERELERRALATF